MELALQQDFLKVPDTPVTFIIVSVILILAAFAGYIIKHFISGGDSGRKTLWNAIYKYAVKQNLSHAHIGLLKDFFKQLNSKAAYKAAVNKNFFKEQLFDYLVQQKRVTTEIASLVSEKLFAGASLFSEIRSAKDLYIGETCSVTVNSERYLAKIVKIENDNLLLSVPGLNTNAIKAGINAELYFYRENSKSCSATSKIQKTHIDALFTQVLSFEASQEEEHLMSDLLLPVKFSAWPFPEDDDKKITLEGVTRKISDRSVLFLMKTENSQSLLASHKIWEIFFEIPGGISVISRGKIVSSKKKPGLYVFLFLDASEQAREDLFNYIKKTNPQRDSIY